MPSEAFFRDVLDLEFVDFHETLVEVGIGGLDVARIDADGYRDGLENGTGFVERTDGIVHVLKVRSCF